MSLNRAQNIFMPANISSIVCFELTMEVALSITILLPFFFHEYVHNKRCLMPLPSQVDSLLIPVLKDQN